MTIVHPDEGEMNSRMEKAVINMRGASRPVNTAIAMDPKKEEHMQCCDCVHPMDVFRCTLECNKVCRFMFYLSFCKKITKV